MRSFVLTRTPLRISFFGGGTDLPGYYRRYGGHVLSFAIDRYVYVALRAGWDDGVTVRCEEPQRARHPDEIEHPIVREALRIVGHTWRGLEIVSLSDVTTAGSGLGSSSAFTVGLLNALYAFRGESRASVELAELACCVELERLQEPIGKQDQYASAVGGCHEYFFRPDGSVEVHPVMTAPGVLPLLDRHVLMFYTGRTRRAGAILADQQSRIDDTAHHLHILRDQVDEGRRLLAEGDVAGLGRLLDAGWQVKKQLSARIRDDEIDRLYTAATAAGVYGGKLLGAGGGGFLFFLCPPDRQDAVRAALGDLREMPVRLGAPGTCVLELEGSRPGDVDLESLQRAG